MPSKSQTSPPIPTSEALDAGVVKGFFTQLKLLTSTAGFDTILAVHDENTKLRSQLESKDLELAKVKEEMNEQKKKKETALSEMFEINEKEKGGHKATKEQVLSLEKVIVDKDKCILERDKATNELEKQVKKLHLENAEEKEKLVNAEQNINTLQQRIQDKESTINKMKSVGSELKEKLNASKKRVKDLEDETASLKGSLAKTQAQLTKLESFAVGYNETNEDSVIESFIGLWDYAKTEINAQLKTNLPGDTLRNLSAWERLRQCELARIHHIPLPCSNTVAAKQMRLAVILAILAREIDKHIFQPTYLAPADNQFRKVLANQAALDNEKESFCRSIILSMDADTQARACSAGIQTVVTAVSVYLDELLSEDQRLAFHKSLGKVAQRAADIWKPIQRMKRRYEPDFEPPIAEDECEAFVFPGLNDITTEKITKPRNQKEDTLAVFPRLSVIENRMSTAYTALIQLRSSQDQWVAAENEMEKEPPSPTIGRTFDRRRASAKLKNLSLPNGSTQRSNGV